MRIYLPLTIFLCYCSMLLQAQNISGFWKGTLTIADGCFLENNIELQIALSGDSITGNSYHYQDVYNYVKKKFIGGYDKTSKKLLIEEGLVTTFKIPPHCTPCIKNYHLQYQVEGNREILVGSWDGKIMDTEKDCPPGTLVLSRIKESAFKEIPEVMVDTGTIRLDFYDNAEIDGDSITVLVNKKVVLSHQLLTAKPITVYITVDLQHTFQEVEMVAENLGSIPPNTALLIITAGDKKYRLYLSSTETKSATVRFLYDKDAAQAKKLYSP
ncbi:MAG: hypothetical protein M3342_21240 [Bacteroidota bacterium]|nr:hypothetical protein [Flavisolibacter sp.]MBD0351739.1 hypothetical protein [Flavisolibacter sp.]MBD0376120.1 hypothetical protein [Flavisolibacter sp.]MDQ3846510.1 hypothetical protein [Bacteroidota bacterium]